VLWTLRPIRWKDKDDRDRSGTVVALRRDPWWPLADFTYTEVRDRLAGELGIDPGRQPAGAAESSDEGIGRW